MKTFNITPIPAPRMTRADAWKKRPVVLMYLAYKDELKRQAGEWFSPEAGWHVIFYLPIPDSFSAKRKAALENGAHTVKPDIDNLFKAFTDALCYNDSYINDVRMTKRYSSNPRIEIVEI
jgi:Holliday junction resolvase RusA-like endonuclease